jgi:hypothetical protein
MPVETFVMGAEGWTPVGHKATRDDHRMLPIGPIHAAEPQDRTSVCGGVPVELDREGRSFVPWGAGTCDRCSESLVPRPAPTPFDAHHFSPRGEPMDGPLDDERAAERTVEEAADAAVEETEAERPIGDARPDRTGPDGEPLGGEGS